MSVATLAVVVKIGGVIMDKRYCIIDINGNMFVKSKDKKKLEKWLDDTRKKAEKTGKLYQFNKSEYAIVNY